MRILLLSDSVEDAARTTAILGAAGHLVRAARDAEAGLGQLGDFEADVILVDLGLRDVMRLAGRPALARAERKILLIAMTSRWGHAERMAELAGFDACLFTPLDPAEFDAAIAAAQSRERR